MNNALLYYIYSKFTILSLEIRTLKKYEGEYKIKEIVGSIYVVTFYRDKVKQ